MKSRRLENAPSCPYGRGQHDVPERRGPECVAHRGIVPLHVQAAEVVVLEGPIAFPRSELGQGDVVELVIAECRPVVADGAAQAQEVPAPIS